MDSARLKPVLNPEWKALPHAPTPAHWYGSPAHENGLARRGLAHTAGR
jgi:hypothetical protein